MSKKTIIIIAIILIGLMILGTIGEKSNPATSYYRDYNNNGREDFGEGVWYEDNDGVHFYD